jgi:DNA-binding XRE family transcriptional regulator
MRQRIKIPRIIKIEKISGLNIQCMFNNGESRYLDFAAIFQQWNISETDFEYPLLNPEEFKKVRLRNYTLSWPNIEITIEGLDGKSQIVPYEIGADLLYQLSKEPEAPLKYKFGRLIRNARLKAGMTQEQLANRSGTTRFYISRIENDKTDLELSTLRKIVEAGLGKKLKLVLE